MNYNDFTHFKELFIPLSVIKDKNFPVLSTFKFNITTYLFFQFFAGIWRISGQVRGEKVTK